jgi:hypothetical protein
MPELPELLKLLKVHRLVDDATEGRVMESAGTQT